MSKKQLGYGLLAMSFLLIPAVHLLMPFFISTEPSFVPAGGGSGSIMAATNVYAQVMPYIVAYSLTPVLWIAAFFLLRSKKSQ